MRSPSTACPISTYFLDGGHTKEEKKMVDETRKIMGAPHLAVSATCVRVPVYNAHSESVNVEFEESVSPGEARALAVPGAGRGGGG